jgi:hypothetical protein
MDTTLRIWDLTTHQQLYEFGSPGDVPTAAAYRPPAPYAAQAPAPCTQRRLQQQQQYELAAGYESGALRVFDMATTTVLQVRAAAVAR